MMNFRGKILLRKIYPLVSMLLLVVITILVISVISRSEKAELVPINNEFEIGKTVMFGCEYVILDYVGEGKSVRYAVLHRHDCKNHR